MNRRNVFMSPFLVLGAAGFSLAPRMASAVSQNQVVYILPGHPDKSDPLRQPGYVGALFHVDGEPHKKLWRFCNTDLWENGDDEVRDFANRVARVIGSTLPIKECGFIELQS